MNKALSILSSAVEVLRRDANLLVLLIRVDAPVSFYQILGIQTHRLNERLSKYLVNAVEARNVDQYSEIQGRVFLMGFLGKADFDVFKPAFRKTIGSESQSLLPSKLSSVAPAQQLAFDFVFAERVFQDAFLEPFVEKFGITELVNFISALKPNDWLPGPDR